MTILVVDDDALITLNTVDLVTEMGHIAIEAYSAAEALSILEQHPEIGALITDYAMPGMSGLDLAKAARALRPGLPILLATAYDELPEDAKSDYPRLEKPFREDEFIRQVDDLLSTLA
ncbi:response regulator [Devosia sp. CAU 1758]